MGFLVFLPFLVPIYLFLEMLGAVDMRMVEWFVMSTSEAYQNLINFLDIM